MMSKAGIGILLGLVTVALAADDAPRAIQVVEPPATPAIDPANDWVISRSKQFRVASGDGLLRGIVARLADETKDELLVLTEEKDEWKVPVMIRLHGKVGDPLPARTIRMELRVVEGISELRIDLHLSRGIEQERFKRALTVALLYERYLRGRHVGDAPLIVAPWLAEGLREASAWRLKQSDHRLYETLFKHGGLFKLDELYGADEAQLDEMDAAMRAAFRVSSGAMVMALLEQPQGKEGFRAFLSEAAAYQGEMPSLLRRHFPELNLSETSLAKWWALQFAAKGGLNLLTDTLTIPQTEAALAAALTVHFRNPDGLTQQRPLSDWRELSQLKEPERIAALRPAQEALIRLSYRCFPSYRPLLKDYQGVLDALAKNQTKTVALRMLQLEETRATMRTRSARARDYLDWFEISRARETSGAFDDYLRLKERLKANPHHRHDPVSECLDRLDRLFHRSEPIRR